MKILIEPFYLIGQGGAAAAAGAMFLVVYLIFFVLLVMACRRIFNFFGAEKRKRTGKVIRKYSTPERREWQGKALVTIPEQRMLDIDVDGETHSFAPVEWKYERVSEGDDIDVIIKIGRIDRKFQICNIGPF